MPLSMAPPPMMISPYALGDIHQYYRTMSYKSQSQYTIPHVGRDSYLVPTKIIQSLQCTPDNWHSMPTMNLVNELHSEGGAIFFWIETNDILVQVCWSWLGSLVIITIDLKYWSLVSCINHCSDATISHAHNFYPPDMQQYIPSINIITNYHPAGCCLFSRKGSKSTQQGICQTVEGTLVSHQSRPTIQSMKTFQTLLSPRSWSQHQHYTSCIIDGMRPVNCWRSSSSSVPALWTILLHPIQK